jgi:hypothetical protein
MMALGLYRSAVLMARLQIESTLLAMVREILAENPTWRVNVQTGRHMVAWLFGQKRIDQHTANRVKAIYSRCSRVVHGQPCPPARARQLLRDAADIIARLKDTRPPVVITGFSAAKGSSA